jgi:hypothetical protein
VLVDTKLDLSGSVAQYGRGTGMIQGVAGQLIGQFARNLEAELQRVPAATASAAAPGAAPDAESASQAGAAPEATPPGLATPRAPAKPISGFALLWSAFLDVLRGLLGRRTP